MSNGHSSAVGSGSTTVLRTPNTNKSKSRVFENEITNRNDDQDSDDDDIDISMIQQSYVDSGKKHL